MVWYGKLRVKNKPKPQNENQSQNIGTNIKENEQSFKTLFQNCSDIIFREITIHGETKLY